VEVNTDSSPELTGCSCSVHDPEVELVTAPKTMATSKLPVAGVNGASPKVLHVIVRVVVPLRTETPELLWRYGGSLTVGITAGCRR
jgi:hypothetical protein